jgi:hypothetical protein
MDQLRRFSTEQAKEKSATHIVNTRKKRHGRPFLFCSCCPVYRIINSAEIVKWVSESQRPLSIVEDRGFQKLMKTGRPTYKIPSRRTVGRDVKHVFKKTRKRIAKMLQVRVQYGIIIIDSLLTGPRWCIAFRYRRLDVSKSQGICCCHSAFQAEGRTH